MADDRLPDQRATGDETAKAAGATGATGLGCLTFVTMPWAIVIFVAIIILIAWIVGRVINSPAAG